MYSRNIRAKGIKCIINLTILECKYNGITITEGVVDDNKSNHIGM